MLTSKPDHLRAFDYIGLHRYFLTFCTFQRQPRFTTSASVDLVLLQIQRASREDGFALVASLFHA